MDEAKLVAAVQHLASGLSIMADMVPSGAPAVKNAANMAHMILADIQAVAETMEASVAEPTAAEENAAA